MSKKISFSICLFFFLWMCIGVSFATDIERVIGAKHLGMAAFTAVADGGNAAIGNPAGLPLIDRTELNIGGSRLLSDIYAGSMSMVGRLFDYGPFGLNVSYLNYGDDISRYGKEGNYIGSMKVVDKFLALSYGKEILQGISIGGKAKGIWLERIGENEKWKDSFSGLSGDVGLLYYHPYRQCNLLSFGIRAQDFPKLFYEEKQNLSYPTINTGIAANFGSLSFGSLTIAADADFETRKLADVFKKRNLSLIYPETFSVGFEYCLKDGLDFRLGFSTGGFAWDKISFFGGLNIKTKSFGIDYAYSGHSILGFDHLGFDHNVVSLYIYDEAPKIFLKASQLSMPADGKSSVTITAVIQNKGGKKLSRIRMVTFEVSDDTIGKLEGKKRITVKTIDGKAEIKLSSTEKEGKVTVTASSPGLEKKSLEVKTVMPPKSTVKTLPYTNSKSFTVELTASDEGGSGLEVCVIQYKDGEKGEWTVWRKEYIPENWRKEIPEKNNYWNTQVLFGEPIKVEEGHTYYFRSQACDNARNWEQKEYVHEEGDTYTTIVNEAPVISVISLPDGSNNATQNISVAITDAVSGVNWKDTVMTINGKSLNDDVVIHEIEKDRIIYPLTTPLPDGKYTVTVETSDIKGNPSKGSWSFHIVTTSPPVSIVRRHQYLPRWSPDGQKYACIEVVGKEDQRLTIYDVTNQNEPVSIKLNGLGQINAELFPLPIDALTSAEANLGLLPALSGFSWAPDSEHYVFINGKLSPASLSQKVKRYDLDLYIGNLKGEITQLTSDSITELYPIWSPDEKYIAYTHSGKVRIQKLFMKPNRAIEKSKESPSSIQMEGEAIAMFPEWAPNSQKIAFSVYQNKDFDIFIYDFVSDKLTQLTQTPHIREYHPVWSPDSEFIAFYSPGVSFKITEQSLESLKSEGVPDDVLEKLQSLENQEVIGEEKFLGVLKETIGDEQTVRFKSLILKHAQQNTFSISIAKTDIVSQIIDSLSLEQLSETPKIDGYELRVADDVRPNVLLGPSWMPSGRHIVYVRGSDNSVEIAGFNLSSIKKLKNLKLETDTTMNSDVQCAQKEAKLIFGHYAAAGGGVSFSNLKIHILPQIEFVSPTIPIM